MPDITAEAIGKLQEIVESGLAAESCGLGANGEIPFIVIPASHKVESLKDLAYNRLRTAPIRKQQKVSVRNADSFIEYWQLFSDEQSRVFADRDTDSFLAVLDYHHAGDGPPRWGDHCCTLTVRHSEEWQIWSAQNGKRMTQAEMATFLEDNAPDVIEPNGLVMTEAARTLEARTEVEFTSGTRLKDGQTRLVFREETKAGWGEAGMEVPDTFTILIPVYEGLTCVKIVARLRFRINSGKLTMWYDLLRPQAHKREAYRTIFEQIKIACGTVFSGKP